MIRELLETPARQAGVTADIAHRPWPPPAKPWLLAQTWDDLLFAHWRVPAESVRGLPPPGLELDEHDGSAWLGVTPFVLRGFRCRGTLPLPWISTFPELNARTYVSAEAKPGIWFFSLDTSSLLAVEGARRAYKLPYSKRACLPCSGAAACATRAHGSGQNDASRGAIAAPASQ